MFETSIAITRESGVIAPGTTSAVPNVAVTAAVNMNRAIKLAIAEETPASRGARALVSTTLAIEWDASFTPFTKVSMSAWTIPVLNRRSSAIRHGSVRCR